uniref:Uncharacterized protein n=1 Tax=Anguilla anguilla TaxID=7936 RepID=A0A0E9S539_ANGAN
MEYVIWESCYKFNSFFWSPSIQFQLKFTQKTILTFKDMTS